MLRRLLVLLLLFPLAVFAGGKAELINPPPVAIPAGLDAKQVSNAIKSALIARTWTVGASAPGQIDATLNIRAHRADIRIVYDDKTVQISYVDSNNLDFKEKKGKQYIHSNYISWVNNLTGDISRTMQLLALD